MGGWRSCQCAMTSFSIFHQIVSGLRTKSDMIFTALSDCPIDVLALSEIGLGQQHLPHDFFPDDFYTFLVNRNYVNGPLRSGGGSALVIERNINRFQCPDLELETECMWGMEFLRLGKCNLIGNH